MGFVVIATRDAVDVAGLAMTYCQFMQFHFACDSIYQSAPETVALQSKRMTKSDTDDTTTRTSRSLLDSRTPCELARERRSRAISFRVSWVIFVCVNFACRHLRHTRANAQTHTHLSRVSLPYVTTATQRDNGFSHRRSVDRC